jgi:protein-disulfide isomerase
MLGGMNRNRLLLLAAAVAAAAIVVVVLIVVGAGKDSTTTVIGASSSSAHAHPFQGVPQRGATLGSADAPATLTVYEDPQCPFCRDWNVNALPSVVADYVRPGKLKIVYRGVNIIGPNSEQGLRAVYAAGRQNKLWNVSEGLYGQQGEENTGWITDEVIKQVASDAGANANAVLAEASSSAVTAQLHASESEARAIGLQGTPTFILQRPLSPPVQLNAALDASGFESALASALR